MQENQLHSGCFRTTRERPLKRVAQKRRAISSESVAPGSDSPVDHLHERAFQPELVNSGNRVRRRFRSLCWYRHSSSRWHVPHGYKEVESRNMENRAAARRAQPNWTGDDRVKERSPRSSRTTGKPCTRRRPHGADKLWGLEEASRGLG